MNPFTLFLDMVAVGSGLTLDLALLGGLVLTGFYLLGLVQAAPQDTEREENE